MEIPEEQALISLKKKLKVYVTSLLEKGGNFFSKQAHLKEDTPESINWHYGYLVTLRDLEHYPPHSGQG